MPLLQIFCQMDFKSGQCITVGGTELIIVWGFRKDLTNLEIRSKLDDLGLGSLVRGTVAWEGDHVTLTQG